jgi:CO/xanthine dehydrogenase Mo-binding subunit
MGNSTKTTLAQILAEKMQMDVNQIHVPMEVNTQVDPDHWKTVASMTTYMAGNAVIEAAEDIIKQIKSIGAIALLCSPKDLEVADGKVFLKDDSSIFLEFKDIVHGFEYPNGNSIGGQIIGKGSFIMRHLTDLQKETGIGKTGPAWTVGAQAVEVEYDKKKHTYRLIKAASVIDAGKVLNPMSAKGIVMGGMCMGLGLATSEGYVYDNEARALNTSLRTYKPLRLGENPIYLVDFVETPQEDSPYGARGFGEHGILGMPGAILNSLSCAADVDLNKIPVTPEVIWEAKGRDKSDRV